MIRSRNVLCMKAVTGKARGESVFVTSVCWHLSIIRSTSFILSNSHDDGLKETRTTNMATEVNI